ncbi:MAG: acyltransferase [Verrucomicrobiota bacterium]
MLVRNHPGRTAWNSQGLRISPGVKLGSGVKLFGFVNLYDCEIGDDTRIGCFVEIQCGVKVGARCKISSHTLICEGVTIEDEVFIGHGVMFINDRWPRATARDGKIVAKGDWECQATLVQQGASIGSGVTILGGLTIGANAMIGAGSVVTADVAPGTTVAGNPARLLPHSNWITP